MAPVTPVTPVAPVDPMHVALLDALHRAGDDATAEAIGRLHGRYRAREDRTIDVVLGEFRALGMQDPAAASPYDARRSRLPGRVVLGGVAAASVDAFHVERSRLQQTARQALDHALRGSANAIRLAVAVRRQVGKDTSDVVERHAGRIAALLDRVQAAALRPGGAGPRPEDIPTEDLALLCRSVGLAWNESDPAVRCTVHAPVSCGVRLDAGRLRETLSALLPRCARLTSRGGRLELALEAVGDRLAMTVDAVHPDALAGAASEVPPDPCEPLLSLLVQQTAAAHGGGFEVRRTPGLVSHRLTIRAPAGRSEPSPSG